MTGQAAAPAGWPAGLIMDYHGVLTDAPAVAEVVARVRAGGTPTALLTDERSVPAAVAALFDVVTDGRGRSGAGARKPAAAAFRGAAATLGVPVERCVVVDDGDANLRGARAAGAVVVRHVDAGTTVAELAILFGLG